MSVQAMTWAFEQQVEPHAKLVLLALANRTNQETGLCFPGQELLGQECSMSARTIRRHLKTLEAAGLVRRRPRMLGEGRGRTSDEYRLAFYDQADKLSGKSRPTGQTETTNRSNQDDQPDTGDRVTVREPKENRKSRPVPDGWRPADHLRSELAAKYPTLNISQEAEKFVEWHGAKGSKFVDHAKAFRLWCRNAVKYQAEKPAKKADHPGWGGVAPY